MTTTHFAFEVKLQTVEDEFGGLTVWIDAKDPVQGAVASLTPNCVSMRELRTNVDHLKGKLDKAVAAAERRFKREK
jgi:hypothetical protein